MNYWSVSLAKLKNLLGFPAVSKNSLDATSVEETLRAMKPAVQTPANLHESIMRRVENVAFQEVRPLPIPRWIPASLALVICGVAILSLGRGPAVLQKNQQTTSQVAAPALNFAEIEPSISSAALAPLSNELEGLHHDLENMKQFLLASLP